MQITKYKKSSKGTYKVYLEDGQELSFYEDVILKYDLLLHKNLDEKTLILADQYNQECDVYYQALHSIENRYKSVYELKVWLQRKEYPEDLIDKAIHKLMEQGYLNDQNYAKSYIHYQMMTTNKGPYRISRELEEKKVDFSIIQEEILVFTEEEQEARIQKIIEKEIRGNHTKGGIVLKQKIGNDLKTLGYDISLIQSCINSFSFSTDKSLAKKEYEKLICKYSRKYQGEELKRVVREKLYRKGLQYEEE